MRSLILVISAIFVLSLGFLVFYWTQQTKQPHAREQFGQVNQRAPLVHSDGSGDYLANGVWVSRYNEKTGDLASRFRAKEYDPQPDGRVKVVDPVAQFFLYDKNSVALDPNRKGLDRTGRRLEISGRWGLISMPRSERGKDAFGQTENTQSPSNGDLYDVTVTMYDQLEGGRATLVVTMNNASFDNETFRIDTEPFVDPATRQKVAADEVPVKLRGDDYDLDGRGLTIKWNDRDRRLQLLQIDHGEVLVLKHPQQLNGSFAPSAPRPAHAPSTAPAGPTVQPSAQAFPAPHEYWKDKLLASSAAQLVTLSSFILHPSSFIFNFALADQTINAPVPAPSSRPVRQHHTGRPSLPSGQPEPTGRIGHIGREGPVTRPKIVETNEPPLYRATFFDDVLVVQDEQELVKADRLLVDFLMNDDSGDDDQSATQPTAKSATRAAAGSPATSPTGAAIGASISAPATAAAPHAHVKTARSNSAATTQPGQSPIEVHWTGMLQVVPLHLDEPLPQGQQVLTFEGAPVIAHQQGSEIHCDRLTYHTLDGLTLLESAGKNPVVMTKRDAQGISTVRATSVTYYRSQHVAVLHNKGQADLPVQGQENSLAQFMRATWTKSCTIHFIGSDENQMVMDNADLEGDVHVRHPQMKLDSDALLLSFEPVVKNPAAPSSNPALKPAGAPAPSGPQQTTASLKKMVAIGKVHCDMSTDPLKPQTIDSDRLTVQTTIDIDGRLVPRTLTAEGDVHTIDPDEELTAQHLFATLMPATQPSGQTSSAGPGQALSTGSGQAASAGSGQAMELQSLNANQDVVVKLKDGTIAHADTLMVDTLADGKRTAKLLGAPLAKINSKQDSITGAIVEIVPDGQQLTVDGAGEMDGTQQDNPATPGRPIKIVWTRSARYDGKANVLDCLGDVIATSTDADGTQNRATGGHMVAHFVDAAPATRPATLPTTAAAPGASPVVSGAQPNSPAKPHVADADDPLAIAAQETPAASASPGGKSATAPASAPARPDALSGGKTMRDITFSQNAEVRSTLNDPSGKLRRLVDLFADRVRYSILPENGKLVRHIDVPVPGKMLFEDHLPPASQPAGQPRTPESDSNSRGTTAFKWTKSMTYDDASQKMYLEGLDAAPESRKVIVDHRDDEPNAQPTRISALEIIADIVPLPNATTQPATQSATKPAALALAPPAAPPATQAATQPATGPGQTMAKTAVARAAAASSATEMRMQVKFINARGNVVMDAKGGELHSERMEYDPIRRLAKAFGSQRFPAQFSQGNDSEHPVNQIQATELDWDLQQDLPHARGAETELRR